MRSKGMTQTSASSSATASQVWWSLTMPSRPMISPAIWKPVTWSRPSSAVTQVLKNPVRIANSDWNTSPLRNRVVPRLTLRRTATTSSMRASSWGLRPTGMHSSRRLQFEHATFMLCPSNSGGSLDGIRFASWACAGVSFMARSVLIQVKLSGWASGPG